MFKWIKKLLGELVSMIIVLIVGCNIIGDVHYNEMLKRSYWRAFLFSPIRFIRTGGNPIKWNYKKF
jgi:hypothetical protein